MPRVVHFEIHATNPERAVKFYREMFGWEITKWEGPMDYWVITSGGNEPGIDGGLLPRRGPEPTDVQAVNSYVCTIEVTALDSAITQVQALGGSVAVPKMPVPGVGWLAYVKDTEGNLFGLMESDTDAA